MVRFPAARRPKSGHWEFRQQNGERSSMGGGADSKEKRRHDLRHYCNSRHYATFFNFPGSQPGPPTSDFFFAAAGADPEELVQMIGHVAIAPAFLQDLEISIDERDPAAEEKGD